MKHTRNFITIVTIFIMTIFVLRQSNAWLRRLISAEHFTHTKASALLS